MYDYSFYLLLFVFQIYICMLQRCSQCNSGLRLTEISISSDSIHIIKPHNICPLPFPRYLQTLCRLFLLPISTLLSHTLSLNQLPLLFLFTGYTNIGIPQHLSTFLPTYFSVSPQTLSFPSLLPLCLFPSLLLSYILSLPFSQSATLSMPYLQGILTLISSSSCLLLCPQHFHTLYTFPTLHIPATFPLFKQLPLLCLVYRVY